VGAGFGSTGFGLGSGEGLGFTCSASVRTLPSELAQPAAGTSTHIVETKSARERVRFM
jgi:hypothetical protein